MSLERLSSEEIKKICSYSRLIDEKKGQIILCEREEGKAPKINIKTRYRKICIGMSFSSIYFSNPIIMTDYMKDCPYKK